MLPKEKRVEILANEFAKLCKLDEIDIAKPISEYGIDSVYLVELLLACEEIYSTYIDFEKIEITEETTLSDIDVQIYNTL